MKKLAVAAVLAALAFTTIACGPPATTGGSKPPASGGAAPTGTAPTK